MKNEGLPLFYYQTTSNRSQCPHCWAVTLWWGLLLCSWWPLKEPRVGPVRVHLMRENTHIHTLSMSNTYSSNMNVSILLLQKSGHVFVLQYKSAWNSVSIWTDPGESVAWQVSEDSLMLFAAMKMSPQESIIMSWIQADRCSPLSMSKQLTGVFYACTGWVTLETLDGVLKSLFNEPIWSYFRVMSTFAKVFHIIFFYYSNF